MSSQQWYARKTKIGKTWIGTSIKCNSLYSFYVKQSHSNNTICHLIYRHTDYSNKDELVIHDILVAEFKNSLGSVILNGMKQYLSNILWLSFLLSQVMMQHKAFVKDLATKNESVKRDTFVMAHSGRNLAKVYHEALWKKHSSDLVSAKMWIDENSEATFYYQELIFSTWTTTKQNDNLFTLEI